MRILFAGGGTGGHIYPIAAVSRALRDASVQFSFPLQMDYLGPIDIYSSALEKEGIKMHGMLSGKLRRYFSIMNFLDIPKFFIGIIQALIKVFFMMPDVIFSKGGPGALPVVFAGWFYRIPIVIHESDATPGLTTLLSARFAKKICISFEAVSKYFDPSKTVLTGNPIRKEFFEKIEHGFAKADLGFKEEEPLILVLGGSQGSKRVNEFTISVLSELLKSSQVLHQTGLSNFEDTQKLSKAVLLDTPLEAEIQHRYKPVPFFDMKNMRAALAAADIVISRAGSGSISEIAASGKPCIIIPLAEAANNHQKENAYALAKENAAIVIEENNLNENILLSQIKNLLGSPELMAKMSKHISAFARPDAAEQIAGEIIALGA